MRKKLLKYICGLALILTLVVIPLLPTVNDYLAIPTQLNIYTNDSEAYSLADHHQSFDIVAEQDQQVVKIEDRTVEPVTIGNTDLLYQYKGFPLKKINTHVSEQYQVIPGGQSIGVNLETLGVLIVGFHYIDQKEQDTSPGKAIGIEIGDSILEMNQQKIEKIDDIGPIVNQAGEDNQAIEIKYKRANDIFEKELIPAYDQATESYKIGLYIRDSAAGIGTMTFYDPQTKMYGALGHVISDVDTKEPIEIKSGTVVRSKITSIKKGNSGHPGEKRASFNKNDHLLGNITKNSSFGVFGQLELKDGQEYFGEPVPIAYTNEVKEGKAQILTVINDEQVETFDIEIISAIEQKNPATKGMIIKVTDERLLDETGGIVQGMSGSPIIQNNKIIGAVTHVFVNDPTSGYGIHIEWMLNEAEINYNETFSQAS